MISLKISPTAGLSVKWSGMHALHIFHVRDVAASSTLYIDPCTWKGTMHGSDGAARAYH
jgi:hypothetical protein